jgi:protein arginine kinase
MSFTHWIDTVGPQSDIVLSTRIRLARNLEQYPFPSRNQAAHLADVVALVVARVREATNLNCHDVFRLHPLELHLLVERHLASPAFVSSPLPRAIGIDESGVQSLMVNEEDHLRLQSLVSGLDLRNAWEKSRELCSQLEQGLEFAYDEQFGYLTSCLSNLGTGMRASAMVHVPGLAYVQALDAITHQVSCLGLTIRGLYGEGSSCSGHLVQLSNQVTLGLTEREILQKVETVCLQLIQYEHSARAQLMSTQRTWLEDQCWRSFALLGSARLMTGDEALRHFSNLRLGVALELLPGYLKPRLNSMLVKTRGANLQLEAGRELSGEERDVVRASVIRNLMVESPSLSDGRGEAGQ